MAGDQPPPKGKLSLYAHLLAPPASTTPGTISSAPVMYNTDNNEDAAAKKPSNSALQFMPSNLKRPQPKKPNLGKPRSLQTSSSSPDPGAKAAQQDAQPDKPAPTVKTTLADWTSVDDDVNGFYAQQPKQQRGGRAAKKRKMNKQTQSSVDWSDIYDPSRPTNYDAYIHSEEKIEAEREWKEYLYASRMGRRKMSSEVPDEEGPPKKTMKRMFAPPSTYDSEPSFVKEPSAPTPPATVPDEATGQDAFARRMRMSATQPQPQALPLPGESSPKPASFTQPVSRPQASATAPSDPSIISRAPVRYVLPEAPAEVKTEDASEVSEPPIKEEDYAPRSNRPGQAAFGKRQLQKWGWTQGMGLGAKGTGIVTPLSTKIEKQQKRPPGQDGGVKNRGGKGTIVGGKKSKAAIEEEKKSKFGTMSEVVVLWGMVDGLDLDEEMSRAEGGILQEIGEECHARYGNVERVFIDRNTTADKVPVFVKFVQQLSALRAVQHLNGRMFNGNTVTVRYYDVERFDNNDYAVQPPPPPDNSASATP